MTCEMTVWMWETFFLRHTLVEVVILCKPSRQLNMNEVKVVEQTS